MWSINQINPPFHLRYWKWLRLLILLSTDVSLLTLAQVSAFLLRFDGHVPPLYWAVFWRSLPVILLAEIPVFFWGGMYQQIWRYANHYTAIGVAKCAFLGGLLSVTLCHLFLMPPFPPRSIFIIQGLLVTVFVVASRFSWRLWSTFQRSAEIKPRERCLIYGAGSGGDLLARHIAANPKFPYKVVGFLDDDPNKRDRFIHGVRIIGPGRDLPTIAKELGVEQVILAMPSASGGVIRSAVAFCQSAGIKPLIMPDMASSLGENIFQPREVDPRDLLKRAPKAIDKEKLRGFFKDKVVLVTGAGGSIGSEICRQVVGLGPKRLILLENSEYNLYRIETELKDSGLGRVDTHGILGSTTNPRLVRKLFEDFRPSIIFHAAASKHVPIVERNPIEGIINNIFGTRNVAEAAIEYGSEHFLLISSDKAVRPTNVMGATKRVCELLIQSLQQLNPDACGFCSVRFGNVLGSSGSVIPRFLDQIRSGGPVTVTHPEMTRYFMLTSEAVALVLQAITLSEGSETFVLNMGEPVKILDMAKQLITLAGKEPDKDIRIVFTGIRPGEKLYEELILEGTETHELGENDIFVAKPIAFNPQETLEEIDGLLEDSFRGNEELSLLRLKRLAGYHHGTPHRAPVATETTSAEIQLH